MAIDRPAGTIGVLGGAFNPPHLGHLVLAQEALCGFGFDRLVVVPTGRAPHKRIEPEPGPELRLEMARRAFEPLERVEVSDLEVAREGPSFAYRTLELLADELRGSQLTFVMGADAARGLPGWERPRRVLELADLAVAARPGVGADAVQSALGELGCERPVASVGMPAIGISSTDVRERVASGKPLRWLVPEAVIELIKDHDLYADGGIR